MLTIDKIRLLNFQSHEDSEIYFGKLLNVIIGGSDQGKTSIIRALRWLLYNEPRGTDFIRVGANSCKVIVTLSDGTEISRERSTSRNMYTITRPGEDEQIFEGFGSDIPEEIIMAHGMSKIYLDTDVQTSLNISYQLEGPFLLSETGSTRAKAIGRIVGVHLVDTAIRGTIKDIHQTNQEKKIIENAISNLEQQLAPYSGLHEEEELILQMGREMTYLEGKINKLDKLNSIALKMNTINTELKKQQDIASELNHIEELESQLCKVIYLAQYRHSLEHLSQRMKITQGYLHTVNKVISDTHGVFEGEELFELIVVRLQQLEKYKTTRNQLLKYNTDIKKYKHHLIALSHVKQTEHLFTIVKEKIEHKKYLLQLSNKLVQITELIATGENYLTTTNRNMELMVENYNSLLIKIGQCPLCYSSIDKEISKKIVNQYRLGGDHNE